MQNVVYLLQKSIKDTRVSIVGGRIPMDIDTIRSLRSWIRMDLLPYCKGGSMIPVDLRQTVSVGSEWIRDPFSGSTDMSVPLPSVSVPLPSVSVPLPPVSAVLGYSRWARSMAAAAAALLCAAVPPARATAADPPLDDAWPFCRGERAVRGSGSGRVERETGVKTEVPGQSVRHCSSKT